MEHIELLNDGGDPITPSAEQPPCPGTSDLPCYDIGCPPGEIICTCAAECGFASDYSGGE